MRLPAQLPQYGFDHEREFALRAELGTFFFFLGIYRVSQIHTAIGTLHQIVINIRAAIATFDFIFFGPRSGGEAGMRGLYQVSDLHQSLRQIRIPLF